MCIYIILQLSDRLTGPKLFKTVKKVEGIHAVPLLPLRVGSGLPAY